MNVQINRMQRLMLIEGFGELLDTDNRSLPKKVAPSWRIIVTIWLIKSD
ncbi:hypothetical protein [Escherichia coli]